MPFKEFIDKYIWRTEGRKKNAGDGANTQEDHDD
jgi:hypothetical protein